MSSIITYKGFRAEVFFDAEDGLLVGHILDIRDIVGFHAESIPELYDHFHDAVDSYLDWCSESGFDPQSRKLDDPMVN